MTGLVVQFSPTPKQDIVLERARRKLKSVIILGIAMNGEKYIDFSVEDSEAAMFLREVAEEFMPSFVADADADGGAA